MGVGGRRVRGGLIERRDGGICFVSKYYFVSRRLLRGLIGSLAGRLAKTLQAIDDDMMAARRGGWTASCCNTPLAADVC